MWKKRQEIETGKVCIVIYMYECVITPLGLCMACTLCISSFGFSLYTIFAFYYILNMYDPTFFPFI